MTETLSGATIPPDSWGRRLAEECFSVNILTYWESEEVVGSYKPELLGLTLFQPTLHCR